MNRVFVLSALTLTTLQANAVVIPFDEVSWKTSRTADQCVLKSDFSQSGYGLRFVKEAGYKDLKVSLSGSSFDSLMDKTIEFRSVPSAWSRDTKGTLITSVKLNGLDAQDDKTNDILAKLSANHWLEITSPPTNVTIPNTSIKKSLSLFNDCVLSLPEITFQDAKNTTLYFRSGDKQLSVYNRDILKTISTLLSKDSSIKKVLIDGYTDNVGDSVVNLKVSKERASKVAYELVSMGVKKDAIVVTGQGERYPISDNGTIEGRNKNRRVNIRLIK